MSTLGTTEYAAPPKIVGGLAGAAVCCVVAAVVSADPAGRLLLGLAAFAVAVPTLRGLLARPALQVGPDGLTVTRWRRPEHVAWADLESVDPGESRRLLVTTWLEIDAGERFMTIPGWLLGATPREVAATVEAARPPG